MLVKFLNIFVLISLFVFTGCEKKEKEVVVEKEKPKVNVEVYSINKETLPIWVDFAGKTEATKEVVVVARAKGNLEKRFFKAGASIKKGDILFKIEDSEYIAILEQKEASKKKNEATLRLAISSLNRYKPLVEKELATREKLDQLVAQKEEVEALIKADESAISQAKLNLSYTNVKATTDGMIGRNLIDIGNIVGSSSENSKLAVIVQSNPLYVNFTPSSDTAALIAKNKSEEKPRVEVHIPQRRDAKTKIYKGKIDFVDNKTNDSTGTVSMRAIVDNPDYSLLAGTFVEIKLFISDKIPVFALSPTNTMEGQLGSYVYVVNSDGKVESKQVKIKYGGKDMIILTDDSLSDGDKVIVSPTIKLRNGMDVVVKKVPNPVLDK